MAILELSIAGLAGLAGADLSPRRFTIREAVSSLFSISLLARSPDPSLDLAALLDQPATLRIVPGYIHVANLGARTWRGIVVDAEQVHALQPGLGQVGLSTYQLRIVPDLFRLTQRRGNRIFQQRSIPEIIDKLLGEWSIPSVWEIDRGRYPRLEYKIQYAESDFSFFSRLLEEAGIAFTFPEEQDGKLTFSDRLESNAPRSGFLRYVDQPNQAAEEEFITSVRLDREVRPGAFRVRDHELRNPDFALVAEAPRVSGLEGRLEQYHFDQGAFLVETGKGGGTPVADDKGIARHDLAYGQKLAERALHAERVGVRSASFESNAFDLAPGSVFSMDLHPHADLSPNQKLLVLETTLEGTAEGEWSLSGHAVFADMPYRPPRQTPKPTVHGLQSATVVGPKGQEVHADEFGRVRVQFPWDREGKKDEGSSCWVRVNQGWGGMGYGMVVLPRIGQEVLVGFAEGDPDLPFVLGRAYNALQQVPYRLPEHKTRSTWKSDSSVGSVGFNEIMFEDLAGKELVWEQAEKDRKQVVRNDEFVTVRHDRQKLVKRNESEHTEGYRTRWVGKDADEATKKKKGEGIDGEAHLEVRGNRREQVEGKLSIAVADDREEAVKGRYGLQAKQQVHVLAGEGLVMEGAEDVTIAGPGGFLRIDASGVTIAGMVVKINAGGSPRKGKGSKPEDPLESEMGLQHEDADERSGQNESKAEDVPTTYGKSIKLEGDAKFRKKTIQALDKIKKTPTGAKMLRSIEASGKTVTIKATTKGNGAGPSDVKKAVPKANGSPGEGTNTTVSYNPDRTQVGDGSEAWQKRPPEVGLAHELVHAYHNANGTNDFTSKGEDMAVGVPPYDKNDVTENKIRSEWDPKQPSRPHY